MKHRFKKLLAIALTASMCIPAFPTETLRAETAVSETDAIVWTDAEKISATQITEDERFINFNEEWKFYFGDSSTAQNVDFIDASWEDINLPHDFSITQDFTDRGEAESGFLLGGTGWYRKKFVLPESFKDKSIVLNFDGVYKDTEVYVNGIKLGEHHYGYTPFAFDIGEHLICDGITENLIAVKAVNNIPSSRWYSGSGIYRDVTLIVANPIHVDLNGTFVTTPNLKTSNGADGTVNIAVDVQNSSEDSANIKVRNTIFEKGSQTSVATVETDATLTASETKTVTANAKVDSPNLWSIEEPNLYTVQTEILSENKVIDSYETEFGFKWYEFVDNTGFKLNGQNVKINGVCMHHDQGALGAAAYYDAIYRQMSIMKNMGANTIRITHNPGAEILVDICNELGLLVIEEFFDGWAWPKNGNSNDFSVYFNENLTEDNQILGGNSSMKWSEFALKSTVKRGRNDASLILWSLGNEIQEGTANSASWNWKEIAQQLISWTEELDTTHPVTSGSNNRGLSAEGGTGVPSVNQLIFEEGGVPGYNYGNISDMNTIHGRYPVFLWSETASAINSRGIYTNNSTGTGAAGGHLTSYDESCVGWGKTAHDSMYPTLSNDFLAGECVWTGFDYIGEPTPWNGTGTGIHDNAPNRNIAAPNSSYFGIVETTGFPKDNYYLYRSQWNKNANTLHLVTAWDRDNMKESNGKTPVWVYSNAAKVELYLNDEKIGTATRKALSSTTTAAGHTRYEYTTQSHNSAVCSTSSGNNGASLYSVFNVAFTAGTISAKAYDENGAEITNNCEGNSSITTPGSVNKLVATPDKESIDADGSSLSYITIDVTDSNGNLKTTADNSINFSLTGNGEIVGVDNGDQATVNKYQQKSVLTDSKTANIKAYAGKALVIIRSTKNSGSFTLTASSDSLASASVTVETNPVGGAIGSSINSYSMSKHCYLPVGTNKSDVRLPEKVTATLNNDTEKEFTINWNNYDESLLNTKGNYRIDGTITNGEQTLNVSVLLHIYAPVIGVQNHSLCTAPSTIPTLPTVSMAYDEDGDAFEEYPVTWDMENITKSSFETINQIVLISGTVHIFGKDYPTTASVRVATPNVAYTNVGTSRDHLVDNAFENGSTQTEDGVKTYNDTLSAVTDGSRPDNGYASSRWSDWSNKDKTEAQTNIQIAMDWATVTTTDKIDIYYFTGGNAVLPTSIKFEYASTSNYNEQNRFLDAEWTIIEHSAATDLPADGLGSATVGKSYKLNELINPQAIRITFGHSGSNFMGINEIEVMHPTYTYDLNTNASLSGITIDNNNITFNDTNSIYVLPSNSTNLDNMTYQNPNNAAVTVLKRSNSLVKIISVSEDGQNVKTYALTSSADDIPTEAEKTAFQTKLNELKQIKSKDLKKNGYSLLTSKIQQAENSIDSLTKSEINDIQTELQTIYDHYKKSDAMKQLETKISEIRATYKSNLYTPASYQALQNLIKEIERSIDMLTDAEIATKSSALDTAVENLESDEPTPETLKSLQDKIDEYKTLDPYGILFTKESLQNFKVLLRTIERQMDNYSETQLRDKITELEDARLALIANPDAPKDTTKQNLQNMLDEYAALDDEFYMDADSYQTLMTLISNIDSVIDTLSESKLQEKSTELNTAYGNLVKKSLEKAVTDYKALNSADYTTESYKILNDLIVTIDGNINDMDVETQKENLFDLVNAYNQLEPVNCTCEITGITVHPANPQININADGTNNTVTLQPSATISECETEGHPDSGSVEYTYAVENAGTTKATVDSKTGVVTATEEGEAVISVTASLNGKTKTQTVTVNVTKLNANCTCEITGLTITPEEPKITMDVDDESGSVDLKATASRNDACPVEGHLTNEPVITYEVLNAGTTEASVDNKGKVTATKAGIATIRVTASLNGKSRYEDISVTVSKSDPDCSCKIDGLTIDPAETKIAIPANEEEGSVTLNPVLSRNDDCSVEGHPNSNKVTYSYRVADPGSTNATVNSKTGAVTATAAGFAKIEVTALLESGEPYVTIVTITVTKHDPNCTCEIDDITFDPAEPKISIEKDATEGSVQLKPTASLKNDDCSVEGHPDSNHITYTFKVEESGDTGAEVDENGNVTATAEGTATIKVTALLSSGEPYSKTIQVKVTKDTTSGEDTEKGPWTITLNGNGATLTKKSIANIKDGAAAAKPANPTRAHYTFLGWSKSVNGAIYNWQTPVTGNFTLYAKWQLKKYYVTFDANGGTGAPARIQVNALSKVSPPKTTPTKKGYKFVCWTSSKNGAAYNWSSPVTKDLTLYAKWTEDAPKFDETSQTTDPKTKITYKVSNADKKTAVVMSSGNKNLKKVEIKEKVEINGVTCTIVEIGKNAFKGCAKLTEVKIGKGVKKINKNAFNGCKKLKKITFQGTKAPSVKSGAFKKTSSKMTVKVPKKMKSSQKKKLLNALKKAGINKKTKIK